LVSPGDVAGQARQAFTNLRLAVEVAGASIDDIVKLA
jgi:enamine deaminase RidA (YjgF/YER057c/UK114 family)